MAIRVFWDVTQCLWVSRSGCFEGSRCLHFQGQAVISYALAFEDEGILKLRNVGYHSIFLSITAVRTSHLALLCSHCDYVNSHVNATAADVDVTTPYHGPNVGLTMLHVYSKYGPDSLTIVRV